MNKAVENAKAVLANAQQNGVQTCPDDGRPVNLIVAALAAMIEENERLPAIPEDVEGLCKRGEQFEDDEFADEVAIIEWIGEVVPALRACAAPVGDVEELAKLRDAVNCLLLDIWKVVPRAAQDHPDMAESLDRVLALLNGATDV